MFLSFDPMVSYYKDWPQKIADNLTVFSFYPISNLAKIPKQNPSFILLKYFIQDVSFVTLEIVQRMKKFNMFYVHLLEKLITTDRSFLMCTQCAYWDKFKILEELSNEQISNLAKFISYLFKLNLIPVTMLKKLDFAEINKSGIIFLRYMLKSLCEISDKAGMFSLRSF